MIHAPVKTRFVTPGVVLLVLVMLAGAVAAIFRYWLGLGAVTNLSDVYPWGIWIAFDILCGVALAAGSFTLAALVYIFGGKKYHVFVRPAVLTGLLGYAFVAVGLLVDLGQPWRIWHPIIMWPEHSVMFEVAWCVMLYMTVLALEFAPALLQHFGWTQLHDLWDKLVPLFVVAALTFFAYIMSHSAIWAGVLFVAFAALAAAVPRLFASRPGLPIILIIAGIVFSTMHQSSLGSLFLLMQDKLSHLWWTPILPVNFFLSAVAAGFAMVIFEATWSAKSFGRPVEKEPLAGLGRMLGYALWICLVVRIGDVVVRGQLGAAFAGGKGALFLIDVLVGLALPAILLSSAKLRENTGGLFTAAVLVVGGVVFNRFNVALLGMTMPEGGSYFPSIAELLITASIVSAIIFLFRLGARVLPVFPREEEEAAAVPAAPAHSGGS